MENMSSISTQHSKHMLEVTGRSSLLFNLEDRTLFLLNFLKSIEAENNEKLDQISFHDLIQCLKICLVSPCDEIHTILRLIRCSIDSELFLKESLEETLSYLIKGFDKIKNLNPENSILYLLDVYTTLIRFTEKFNLCKNPEKLEIGVDKITTGICETVLKANKTEYFLSLFSNLFDLIILKNSEYFISILLNRKSLKYIIQSLLEITKFNQQKTQHFIQIFFYFLENFKGNLDTLQVEQFSSIFLNYSLKDFQTTFDILYTRVQLANDIEDSQQVRKELIKLLLQKDLSSEAALLLFNKTKTLNWEITFFKPSFISEMKRLIISSNQLSNKIFLLEVIFPWISEGISMTELKLIIKACSNFPYLTSYFFRSMLEFSKQNYSRKCHFKTDKNSQIFLEFEYNISLNKEFSLWTRVFLESLPQTIMVLQINKFITLAITAEKLSFKIEIIKINERPYVLLSHRTKFTEKEWTLIGLSFNLRKKHKGKYKLGLTINERSEEVLIEEIKTFKYISSVQFNGDCKIEFFNIYSSRKITPSFFPFPKDNEDLLYAKKHYFLELSAKSGKPECIVPMKHTIKANRIFHTPFFELIKFIGSINVILPIIMNTTESAVFEFFFKILSEMSKAPDFNLILDDLTFPILRQILTEKSRLLTAGWLDAIEGFLLSFRLSPQYQKAVNNLYLNPLLWSGLGQEYFIYYMEGIKTHLTSNEYQVADEEVLDIYYFFNEFAGLIENKKAVYSYMLFILSHLLLKVKKEKKVKILSQFFEALIEDCFNYSVFEDLDKFIGKLVLQDWDLEDEIYLQYLICVIISVKDRSNNNAVINLIELWLQWCFIYYKKGKYLSLAFVENFIIFFTYYFGYKLDPKVCEAVLDYISTEKFASSELIILTNAVLQNIGSDISDLNIFNENLNILIYYCEKKTVFRNRLCKQEAFPKWVLDLLKNDIFINEELIKLIILCTGNTELNNFDKLRLILYELLGKNRLSFVFKILKEIFPMIFPEKQIETSNKKYLLEFLNLAEDVITRTPYDLMDRDCLLSFIKSCIIPLKFFSFSKRFPNLSGLSIFSVFDKVKHESPKNCILLREGGMARQLLGILFYGLSYGSNQEIEDFLLRFSNESSNKTKSRLEWLELGSSENVKICSIFSKAKRKLSKNLVYLYIYIEWVDIFRVYIRRQYSLESIKQSISSFSRFIVESNFAKKVKSELNLSLDLKGCKEFYRTLLSYFNHLTSVYLPEFQDQYDEVQRYQKKTATAEEKLNLEDTYKHLKLKQDIREYLKSLSDHLKNSDLLSFINNKNTDIECLFKILTSLKIFFLSNFYKQEPDLETLSQETRKFSSFSFLQTNEIRKKKPYTQKTGCFSQQYLKRILKEHKLFCGNFSESTKGKICLKSNSDQLGRRLITKAKGKQGSLKQRKMSYYLQLADSLEVSKSIDCGNYEESSLVEGLNTEVNEDPEEVFLSSSEGCIADFECEVIYIKGFLYGTLNIHEDYLIFTSKSSERPEMTPVLLIDGEKTLCSFSLPEYQIKKKVVKIWVISEIIEIIFKKFIHNTCSIEIYLKSGKSHLINFYTKNKLKEAYSTLKLKFQNISFLNKRDLPKFKEDWKTGKISNFDYLMILNKLSSRSFNNLSQYPVFPWILKDYSNEKLDFRDKEIYRNLMYPVCAQTEQTRQVLKKSLEKARSNSDLAYNFGTHYSAGGTILYYLLRIQPFTQENLNLHKGTFDIPDRIFRSVKKTWKFSQTTQYDTKELIPEFFYLPELFLNSNNEPLGVRQNGKKVNDVKLPKWSKRNVYLFLVKHWKALDSEYVSQNLNYWIDLTFGYRQKGKKAEEFCNLFYPITYQDVYTRSIIEATDILQQAYYCQAVHYGQIPECLFAKPHLKREVFKTKKSLPERLLSNKSYECLKKLTHYSKIIPLGNSSFFIVLLCEEKKIVAFTYNWLSSSFDSSSQKKFELKGVFPTDRLMAVIFTEYLIATAGYSDYSLALHDFSGALKRLFYFHSLPTSDVFGGSSLISASFDSSLVIWNGESKVNLHGHVSSVVSVAGVCEYRLVASCSEYILIHDCRSGEAIHRINEKASRVCPCGFGMFLFQIEDEIKVYYLNGQLVGTFEIIKGKQFLCINEYLIKEERGVIRMVGMFESVEKLFYLVDAVDLVSFYYDFQRDCLMFVNRVSNSFVLCSLECGKENIEYW